MSEAIKNRANLLLSPYFVLALGLLILNDHYLKFQYPGLITGKISDIVGLVVFVFLVSVIWPSSRKWIAPVTGLLFVLWKSPWATPFIQWHNALMPYDVQRVEDYTDLAALMVLPWAHFYIQKIYPQKVHTAKRLLQTSMGVVAAMAIMATSLPRKPYVPDGDVLIDKNYKIEKTKAQILTELDQMGYVVSTHFETRDTSNSTPPQYREVEVKLIGEIDLDSLDRARASWQYFSLDSIELITEGVNKYPIKTLNFRIKEYHDMTPSELQVINISINDTRMLQDYRTLKRMSKIYEKVIREELVNKLK